MVVTPFLQCDLCQKDFSGPEPYAQHLVSQAHLKRAAEPQATDRSRAYATVQPTALQQQHRCEVCKVNMSGPVSYRQHVEGSKHTAQVNKQRILKDPAYGAGPAATADTQSLKCHVCEKCFSGPESYEQHLRSKKHQRKVDVKEIKQRLTGQQLASCPPNPDAAAPTAELRLPDSGHRQLYPQLPVATEHPEVVPRAFAKEEAKKPTGCSLLKCFFSGKKRKAIGQK